MAVEDLTNNGKNVAVVKFHDGDAYATAEADARHAYYAINGWPTAEFDGTTEYGGGSHSSSIYGAYLPLYNAAIGVATPFNLSATHSISGNTLTVNYSVNQLGANASSNLRVHVAVTESKIPQNWQGMTKVDFAMRKMAPDQNGTAFTLTQGNTYSNTATITLAPAWVQANMEVVVWIQDNTTKEVFNAQRAPLLASSFAIDPTAVLFTNPISGSSCASSIAPEVVIRNNGNTTLTSVDINYNVNGTTGTYNWTGNLPFYANEVVTLPAINFTSMANNTLTISLSNPNGGATDENMTNNAFVTNNWAGVSLTYAPGNYTFELKQDNFGSETTWEFRDQSDAVIASGGPYPNNSNAALITQTIPYSGVGCVKFRITDAFGDGICCGYGNGYFNILNASGQNILTGSNFGSGTGLDWILGTPAATNDRIDEEVSIFPSPNNGRFTVNLGETNTGESTVSIMTIEGKVIQSAVVEGHTFEANITNQAAGMYMVRVETSNGVAIKKVTKE